MLTTMWTRPRARQPVQVAPPPRPLSEQLEQLLKTETVVAAFTGYYLVTFPEPVTPRRHLVLKSRVCTCAAGANCPAVLAVADYLQAGGERAADVPAKHLIPEACPRCGGAVKFEPRLCSPARGAGWVCAAGGEAHYWNVKWAELVLLATEGRVTL
jgi:hypothetical protein